MFSLEQAQPYLKCLAFASFFWTFPISVHLQTGNISSRSGVATKIACNLLFAAEALKVLHVLYALAVFLSNFNGHNLPVIILTCIWLALTSTSLFWNYEMFYRANDESVILFNSVKYGKSTDVEKSGKLKTILVWCKSLKPLSLQELLCVLTPFIAKMFIPLYVLLMILFPNWKVFATSFFYDRNRGWEWKSELCVLFELIMAFCYESNILFRFYLELSLQSCHLGQLKRNVHEQKR